MMQLVVTVSTDKVSLTGLLSAELGKGVDVWDESTIWQIVLDLDCGSDGL